MDLLDANFTQKVLGASRSQKASLHSGAQDRGARYIRRRSALCYTCPGGLQLRNSAPGGCTEGPAVPVPDFHSRDEGWSDTQGKTGDIYLCTIFYLPACLPAFLPACLPAHLRSCLAMYSLKNKHTFLNFLLDFPTIVVETLRCCKGQNSHSSFIETK